MAEVKLSTYLSQRPTWFRGTFLQSAYPAVTRDLNLVVEEAVRWAELRRRPRRGGPCFESLEYRDTYRDPERLGGGEKSILFCGQLDVPVEGALTGGRADVVRATLSPPAAEEHGARFEREGGAGIRD